MATRMRTRANRAGRRRGGGRATPGGAAGLVSRVTGMLGGGAGSRGRRRGTGVAGAGLANRVASFMRGFMSGGSAARRGRGRRRY
jgi:hypothetical protein